MSKLLRDPTTGKIRAKGGKLLTGNAGDPCCCGTCRWVALQCPVTATPDYYVFIAADAPLANWCVCEGKPVDVTASVQISPTPGELGQLPAPGDRMAVDSAILSNVGGNVSIHIIAGSIDFTAGVASTEKCQCATVGTFSGFGINFGIVSGSARLTVVRSQTCPDAAEEQCCSLQMIEACEATTLRATLVGSRCPGSFSLWNQTRYAHIYINDVKVDERETHETDLVWTISLAAGDRLFAVTAQSGITSLASTYRFGAYDIYFAGTGGAASPATTNALVTGASVTTSDGNIPIGAAASDKYPCQPEVVADMTVSVDGKSFDLAAADATTDGLTQTPTTKHLWTFPSPGPGEPAYKFVSGQVAPGVYYLTASRVNADGPGVTIANEPLAIWYKFACSPTAGDWIAFAVSDHLTGAPCITDSSSPGSSSGGSSSHAGSSSTPGSSGGGSSSHAGSSHGSSSTGGSSGGTGGSSGGGTGSSHTGSSTGGSGSGGGSSHTGGSSTGSSHTGSSGGGSGTCTTGRWPLTEGSGTTAHDTDCGRNGTITDGTWTSTCDGAALSFNGSTSKVVTAWNGPTGTGPMSVSFWIKTTSTEQQHMVYWGQNSGYGSRFGVALNTYPHSAGDNRLCFSTSSATYDWGDLPGLFDGNWHHVVLVKPDNAVGTDIIAYLDGVSLGTASEAVNFGVSTINIIASDPVWLGAVADSTQFFAGELKDVHIVDRAYTSTDVDSLGAAHACLPGTGGGSGSGTSSPCVFTDHLGVSCNLFGAWSDGGSATLSIGPNPSHVCVYTIGGGARSGEAGTITAGASGTVILSPASGSPITYTLTCGAGGFGSVLDGPGIDNWTRS